MPLVRLMRRVILTRVMLALVLPAASGIGAGPPSAALGGPGTTATTTATAGDEARDLYASTCASCHGTSGRGDGMAAAGLPTRPVNFTDPAWQGSVSDDEIARAIVGGGAAVGKSPLMPANPALREKPAVVAALRATIRSFAGLSLPAH